MEGAGSRPPPPFEGRSEPPRLTDAEEVEFKLAVIAEPAETFAYVARLEQLAGERLGPPTRHTIHDLYWDTADRSLGARRLTLRLREIDGQLKLTAKGASSSSGGFFRRQELEVAADRAGWRTIRDGLAEAGVVLADSPAGSDDPAAWLRTAGLIVTQDRVTERVVRHAYAGDRAVAEIALDTTEYRFGDRTVEFREIEIEQLAGGPERARALGEALLAELPGRLEPSTMGKYSRGLELQRAPRSPDEDRPAG